MTTSFKIQLTRIATAGCCCIWTACCAAGVVADKVGQLARLFEFLEEDLDVPTAAIEIGDGLGAPSELVGHKDHFAGFALHLNQRDHAAQFDRIGFASRPSQPVAATPGRSPVRRRHRRQLARRFWVGLKMRRGRRHYPCRRECHSPVRRAFHHDRVGTGQCQSDPAGRTDSPGGQPMLAKT